jgi:hypothetical protein
VLIYVSYELVSGKSSNSLASATGVDEHI